MRRHSSSMPLLVGLALAAVLHAGLLPVAGQYLQRRVTVQQRPELSLQWSAVPETVQAGQPLVVELAVTNQGGVEAAAGEVELLLSRDRKCDEQDVLWRSRSVEALASGASQRLAMEASVPGETIGPWFLIARLPAVEEASPAVSSLVWFESVSPPRLVVSDVDAPATVLAGGTLTVGWTLRNDGAGWARPGWTDTLVLSKDQAFSADDLLLLRSPRQRALGPGKTLDGPTSTVGLPLDLAAGRYFLVVQPDAPGAEAMAVPVAVASAEHADLQVESVQAAARIVLDEPTKLRFDVRNASPRPTGPDLWGDRVYLSVDDVLDGDDLMLLSMPRMEPLDGAGRYRSGPHAIVVPSEAVVSERMFLIVVADDENNIDEGRFEDNNQRAFAFTPIRPQDVPPPDQVELGKDDQPDRVTVAWISHEDFQDLQARHAATHQPLVQDQADPMPNAPLEVDPDQGTPSVAAPQPIEIPSPRDQAADPPPDQMTATTPFPVDQPDPGPMPHATADPTPQEGNAPQTSPGIDATATTAQPAVAAPPVQTPREGENPTRAPRSDKEADPTIVLEDQAVRPGQVLTGPGIEIKTVRPRFSVAAQIVAVPRNPTAVITFDADGTVSNAVLSTTTGFDNVDGPILSSLYQWKATGKRVEGRTSPFQIEMRILLGSSEPDEEKEKPKDENPSPTPAVP